MTKMIPVIQRISRKRPSTRSLYVETPSGSFIQKGIADAAAGESRRTARSSAAGRRRRVAGLIVEYSSRLVSSPLEGGVHGLRLAAGDRYVLRRLSAFPRPDRDRERSREDLL